MAWRGRSGSVDGGFGLRICSIFLDKCCLNRMEKSISFRGRTGGKLSGTEVNDRTLARKTGARHDIRKMYMSGAHVQCRTCETLSHLDPYMCLTSQLPTWPDVSTG